MSEFQPNLLSVLCTNMDATPAGACGSVCCNSFSMNFFSIVSLLALTIAAIPLGDSSSQAPVKYSDGSRDNGNQ